MEPRCAGRTGRAPNARRCLELARVGRWIRERVAARSWQGGGAPRTGSAQANDNEARCDAGTGEPSTPDPRELLGGAQQREPEQQSARQE